MHNHGPAQQRRDRQEAKRAAYGDGHEAAGSALQLVINVAAIVAAGVLTLLVQLAAGRRAERRRPGASRRAS